MKEINIAETSHNTTLPILFSTMDDELDSSPSSFNVGGRAIDRYNPIITDEKRRGAISQSAPTSPLPTTPNNITKTPLLKSPLSPLILRGRIKRNDNKKKLAPPTKTNTANINITNNNDDHDHDKKSYSKPLDVMKKMECTTTRKGAEYVISPPQSSRYLLDDTPFLNVLSDFDPVLKLVPYDSKMDNNNNNNNNEDKVDDKLDLGSKLTNKPSPSPSSSGSQNQVVMLRVSLHCRGCEKKMKKHLSRMPGVTSFNIDFAAKKVTVIGDVTPLEVLASISKVKNAQVWTPTMSSASSYSTPIHQSVS